MSETTSDRAGGGTAPWRVVAEREISTQLRSKGFQIQAGLLLVGVIASIVLLNVLNGQQQRDTVAVVDGTAASALEQASSIAAATGDDRTVEVETYDDVGAAERAVRDGDADAALVPAGGGSAAGYDLVGDDSVDAGLAQVVSAALTQQVLASNAAEQDVDLEALGAGTEVQQRLLDPDSEDAGTRQVASLIFVLLFYLTALTFGLTIATSVSQEKESRIVEILAAAVPLRAQLWGKIVGTSVLAIGQTILLALAGVVGLLVSGVGDTVAILAPAIGWYVVFFVLGFVTLASLWAVAGALASRMQDVQTATAPLQILLFAPYVLAFAAGERVQTVASMLPVVSTMLMPARLATDDVPVWQLAVAIVVTIAAAVVFVRVGARVYERNLLRTGRRIGFREAFRVTSSD